VGQIYDGVGRPGTWGLGLGLASFGVGWIYDGVGPAWVGELRGGLVAVRIEREVREYE